MIELENFEIVKELGQGGMGVVYLAREKTLDRSVALKLIRNELLDNPTVVKRFEREAQAAARLRHPNIVQIYSIGEENGVHFTVMEYVDGKGLDVMIGECGYLPVEKAVDIVCQVAGALSEAHTRDIIHRDIKPSNILVDSLGRVTVTDFGLARIRDVPGVTQEGELLGTPEYMSPERTKELGLNPESDIYSLGVVLYELLTGKVPFRGDSPYQTLDMHCHENVVAPDKLNPEIPKQLVRIVNKMLAKDTGSRYGNAKELMVDLERFQNQMEKQTVPLFSPGGETRLTTRLANWFSANRTIFYSAALFLLFFFFLKYMYFDPLQNLNGSFNAAPYSMSTTGEASFDISFPDHPRLEAFAKLRGVRLALLALVALGVSFWFWMLVDCLSSDDYPENGLFARNRHLDRVIWLLVFAVFNLFGALFYKALISKHRKGARE